ncbi:MAG: hypothetical protein AB1941_01910 [Gemmatimonadota bacterium]
MKPLLDLAEAGLFARLSGDAEYRSSVGVDGAGDLRLSPGHWQDTEDPGDYPRQTVSAVERPIGPGRGWVHVTLDTYVWYAAQDPDAKLAEIDGRAYALLEGQVWRHEGARLAGDCTSRGMDARTWPAIPGRPIRRTRTLRILVSS